MKKLKLFVISLCAMFVALMGVNAESFACSESDGKTVEAQIGTTCYTKLSEAVAVANKAEEKTTIEVFGNVQTEDRISIDPGKSVELNLQNGATITRDNYVLYVKGTLKITGNGTIENTLDSYYNGEDGKYSTTIYMYPGADVTIDKGITVKGSDVVNIQPGENPKYTLNVYGTLITKTCKKYNDDDTDLMGIGINVNGTINKDGNVKIHVHDGAVLKGEGIGLYLAGYSETIIDKAQITGTIGIGIKSGKLTLNNPIIRATYEKVTAQDYLTGITPTGAAIQVESNSNPGYPGDIEISINGGTYTSENNYAFQEYVAKDKDTSVKTIEIKAGTFESNSDDGKAISVSDKFATQFASKKFIADGTVFTVKGKAAADDVLAYAAEGSKISQSGMVGKLHNITAPEKVENGTLTVNENAVEGETVVIKATANEGYIVKEVSVSGVEVTKNADGTYSFVMPDKDVTVTVSIEVEPKEVVVEEKAKGDKEVTLSKETDEVLKDSLANTTDKELQELLENNDVTVELQATKVEKESLAKEEIAKFENVVKGATVTEFFDLSILVKAEGEKAHYLKELSKPITLTIDLPKLPEIAEGYSRKYYIIREHDGVYEKLNATVENGKLSFATDKFSEYALAYVDEKIENPSTLDGIAGFVTLAIASLGIAGYSIKKYVRK